MLHVRLPNGTVHECATPARVGDVLTAAAASTPGTTSGAAIAAVLDGQTVGLDAPLSYNDGGGDRPADRLLRARRVPPRLLHLPPRRLWHRLRRVSRRGTWQAW